MNEIRKIVEGKIYKLYNLFFWGFYFSAGCFFCKNKYKNFSNEFIYSISSM
ncbi:hypothetical protein H8923_11075 [Romboutsia hominis]|uniref:Lipoprotein n=1 Tax=Romboutsia faecis TaxID=2764597 RepID=A0ABR7JQW5_9FIRM|nr:hypothetical protein [Romboutsia faecis]MBC5997307.1 hypothetical protein [Romboutsia faecis]